MGGGLSSSSKPGMGSTTMSSKPVEQSSLGSPQFINNMMGAAQPLNIYGASEYNAFESPHGYMTNAEDQSSS